MVVFCCTSIGEKEVSSYSTERLMPHEHITLDTLEAFCPFQRTPPSNVLSNMSAGSDILVALLSMEGGSDGAKADGWHNQGRAVAKR